VIFPENCSTGVTRQSVHLLRGLIPVNFAAFNVPTFSPADNAPIAVNQFGPLRYMTNQLRYLSSLNRQDNSVGDNRPEDELKDEKREVERHRAMKAVVVEPLLEVFFRVHQLPHPR
jgi:hypothetical protein